MLSEAVFQCDDPLLVEFAAVLVRAEAFRVVVASLPVSTMTSSFAMIEPTKAVVSFAGVVHIFARQDCGACENGRSAVRVVTSQRVAAAFPVMIRVVN